MAEQTEQKEKKGDLKSVVRQCFSDIEEKIAESMGSVAKPAETKVNSINK